MASTSAPRGETSGAGRRFSSVAATLCVDYKSLIVEIRKAMSLLKGVAVDLEKENRSDMVKELEDAVLELLATSDECAHFSSAIQTVCDGYAPPGDEPTDFKRVLEDEFKKTKGTSASVPQSNPLYRQFKEAVWNVHHAGQPMPGEEQEDLVMTSTQINLLNTVCPLTGKPVFELESPVRCQDCKHIYDKGAIMNYIKTKKPQPRCPVAGCPRILQAGRVLCDPLLPIEIDEARSRGDEARDTNVVEDFTGLDDY